MFWYVHVCTFGRFCEFKHTHTHTHTHWPDGRAMLECFICLSLSPLSLPPRTHTGIFMCDGSLLAMRDISLTVASHHMCVAMCGVCLLAAPQSVSSTGQTRTPPTGPGAASCAEKQDNGSPGRGGTPAGLTLSLIWVISTAISSASSISNVALIITRDSLFAGSIKL